jgi:hypothetical protein
VVFGISCSSIFVVSIMRYGIFIIFPLCNEYLTSVGRYCCHFSSDNCEQGGTIRGSINLPAQSLYPSIPTLYSVLKAGGVQKVIWYCCMWHGPSHPLQNAATHQLRYLRYLTRDTKLTN